ncbi:MAG: hypothetical protein NT031_18795, partial [Planctomycetota bacterium]|nr:hypothetical protein [Planctomycetota bacterium]
QLEGLNAYLTAREYRQKIDAEIERSVPGLRIQVKDDQSRRQFAAILKESLSLMKWFLKARSTSPWVQLVCDCLFHGQFDRIAPLLEQVRGFVERLAAIQRSIEEWVFGAHDALASQITAAAQAEVQCQFITSAVRERIERLQAWFDEECRRITAELHGVIGVLSALLKDEG